MSERFTGYVPSTIKTRTAEATTAPKSQTIETATMEELATIIEEPGYGQVNDVELNPTSVEEEAIVGLAAAEFAAEGKLHPERYQPIVDLVERAARHYHVNPRLIFDFGCGPGILTRLLGEKFPQARVWGIDKSTDMLQIAKQGVAEAQLGSHVGIYSGDIRDIPGNTGELADIVVSRNMTHRLIEDIENGLASMVQAVNERGFVYNQSFLRVNPSDKAARQELLAQFRARNNYAHLQEAWLLAMLNAPSYEDYERAAQRVAQRFDVQDLQIRPDATQTAVKILIKR